MMKKSLVINWKNESLATAIDYPSQLEEGERYPLIIICHGFIGSKVGVDRLFVKAAQEFNKEQSIVLRFDLAGCGESSGEYGKTGLHDFIDQLATVIEFASKNIMQIDRNQITLLGHSLGGATAVLTAVMDKRIKRLVLWSAAALPYKDIRRIVGKEKVRLLKHESEIDYLGYSLTKPFFDSLVGYEPLQTAVQYTGNVLIVHGTGDEDLPVQYAKEYARAFSQRQMGRVTSYEIAGANHTISNGEHFSELMRTTIKWLNEEVKAQQNQNVSA
ncbi:alpha/beta hydrolase [Bacillus tuaregi]|uniref:alpha/beta hydrolase n=1 Tax=Bacillus tuaregi TaxID=1816695 RepID=UPI001F3F48BF|nr:alpha/beta fold hydrolase [Bacillus tuaregi]